MINIIDKMQKAISNKIQLGQTLNPLQDYAEFSESMIRELNKI